MTELSIEVRASDFAKLVKPVMPLADQTKWVPLLAAVKIETLAGHLTAAATDRFRFGLCRTPIEDAPEGFSALIGLAELRRILAIFKPTKGSDSVLRLTVEGDATAQRLRVTQTGGFDFIDGSMTFSLQVGDYPKIPSLFANFEANRSKPASILSVNSVMLADFQHAVRERGMPMEVYPANHGKPIVVTVGDHFIGALMPVRSDPAQANRVESWIEFMSPTKPAETEAA